MSKSATLVLVLAVAGATTTAQSADRLIATGTIQGGGPLVLYEMAPRGAVLATIAVLPGGHWPEAIEMAEDNRSLRVFTRTTAQFGFGTIFDVDPSGTVTTFFAGLPLIRPSHAWLDDNGRWRVLNGQLGSGIVDVLDVTPTAATTITSFAGRFVYGASEDVVSGQLVLRTLRENVQAAATPEYVRVDPRTGTITAFAPARLRDHPIYGAKRPPFDPERGGVLDLAYHSLSVYASLVFVDPENGLSEISGQLPGEQPIDLVRAGGRSHPVAFHAFTKHVLQGYSAIQIAGDGSVRSVTRFGWAGYPLFVSTPICRKGSRHLAWSLVAAPNRRTLAIDVPGESGRPYALAFSLRGAVPGLRLLSGRTIPLAFDALSTLCLSGGIPGVLDRTIGRLDASGRAVARIDANALGAAARGVTLFGAAVVLDPSAPDGIAHILGPTRVDFR